MALLLAGCASCFEHPVKDAAVVPYRPPSNAHAAVFRGMPNPQQAAHLRRATFPRLSADERDLLRRVNREVNHEITYLSDEDNYGWMDYAVEEPRFHRPLLRSMPPARYGDCEDYALTKKHRLVEQGMDPSQLFVVMTKIQEFGGTMRHVVLAVPEGSDWWILNNWDNRIEPASFLAKWWKWDFYWPRFDEYQRLVRARNGSQREG